MSLWNLYSTYNLNDFFLYVLTFKTCEKDGNLSTHNLFVCVIFRRNDLKAN